MMIEMPVFEGDETPFDFFRRRFPRGKPPLAVRSDTRPQQFSVPVGYDGGIGDMEQLPGKAEYVCRREKRNEQKRCFPGDGQPFEECMNRFHIPIFR